MLNRHIITYKLELINCFFCFLPVKPVRIIGVDQTDIAQFLHILIPEVQFWLY